MIYSPAKSGLKPMGIVALMRSVGSQTLTVRTSGPPSEITKRYDVRHRHFDVSALEKQMHDEIEIE